MTEQLRLPLIKVGTFEELGKEIYEKRPKKATGVYITQMGIKYGYRTNPDKFPYNFITFDQLLENQNEQQE